MKRIRRHQQGTLREKKRAAGVRGGSLENTPSRSHSFTTKENHFRTLQVFDDQHTCVALKSDLVNQIPSRCFSFHTSFSFVLRLQSQMRRREDLMSFDIQELEASLRHQEVVREQETPSEEIARLKDSNQADFNLDREARPSLWRLQGTSVTRRLI